jgi:arylsulfatase
MLLTLDMRDRQSGEGGVLIASGARQGGYILYVRGDELVFEHLALGRRSRIAGPIAPGSVTLALSWSRHDDGATVTLLQNGRPVARGEVELAVAHPSFWGLDVGHAPAAPITDGYAEAPALRSGVLQSVTLDFREAMTNEDMADLIGQAE